MWLRYGTSVAGYVLGAQDMLLVNIYSHGSTLLYLTEWCSLIHNDNSLVKNALIWYKFFPYNTHACLSFFFLTEFNMQGILRPGKRLKWYSATLNMAGYLKRFWHFNGCIMFCIERKTVHIKLSYVAIVWPYIQCLDLYSMKTFTKIKRD